MKRVSIAIVACAGMFLVGAPAVVAEKPGSSNGEAKRIAAKACNAEKKADKDAFREHWGKHAMRECKRAMGGELADEAQNAAQECLGEREADLVGFREQYGTNENGKNAMGKCVSERVHAEEGPPTS